MTVDRGNRAFSMKLWNMWITFVVHSYYRVLTDRLELDVKIK